MRHQSANAGNHASSGNLGLCWWHHRRKGYCVRKLGWHCNLERSGIARDEYGPPGNTRGHRGCPGSSQPNCSPCSTLRNCDCTHCHSIPAYRTQNRSPHFAFDSSVQMYHKNHNLYLVCTNTWELYRRLPGIERETTLLCRGIRARITQWKIGPNKLQSITTNASCRSGQPQSNVNHSTRDWFWIKLDQLRRLGTVVKCWNFPNK